MHTTCRMNSKNQEKEKRTHHQRKRSKTAWSNTGDAAQHYLTSNMDEFQIELNGTGRCVFMEVFFPCYLLISPHGCCCCCCFNSSTDFLSQGQRGRKMVCIQHCWQPGTDCRVTGRCCGTSREETPRHHTAPLRAGWCDHTLILGGINLLLCTCFLLWDCLPYTMCVSKECQIAALSGWSMDMVCSSQLHYYWLRDTRGTVGFTTPKIDNSGFPTWCLTDAWA